MMSRTANGTNIFIYIPHACLSSFTKFAYCSKNGTRHIQCILHIIFFIFFFPPYIYIKYMYIQQKIWRAYHHYHHRHHCHCLSVSICTVIIFLMAFYLPKSFWNIYIHTTHSHIYRSTSTPKNLYKSRHSLPLNTTHISYDE